MHTSSLVSFSVENHIAYVGLNRPEKHNALNLELYKLLSQLIDNIKKDHRIRVVILYGHGPSFCSGIDLNTFSHWKHVLALLWKWLPGNANLAQRVSYGWQRLKVPVIVVLHGKCWGGGMQIALGGDFRIATPETSLAIMETKWGIIPDMSGTISMVGNLALDQAMKLAMTSNEITAVEALNIGLVTEVTPDPMLAAKALAELLLERSPDTNQAIKRFYGATWVKHRRKILAKETLWQIKMLGGKNQKIAVKKAKGQTHLKYK